MKNTTNKMKNDMVNHNKTKSLALTVAMLGATAAQAAFVTDGTLALSPGPVASSIEGGPFTVTQLSGTPSLGNFVSFCLEYNEDISLFKPGNYDYHVNSGAVAGGVSGVTTIDPNTGLGMDNVSIGTAYLYSEYRKGNIPVTTVAEGDDLQKAIWILEGEIVAPMPASMATKLAAVSAVPADWVLDSNGAYGVVALNLFNGPNSKLVGGYNLNQDMLGIVPEPSTYLAGLGALGMLGMFGWKSRK